MEINKYKIKKINKSISFNRIPFFHSTDTFFNYHNYGNKTVNNSCFSPIRHLIYQKNRNKRNEFLRGNVSLINLPGITTSNFLQRKSFNELKLNNDKNKTRNKRNISFNVDGKKQKSSLLCFDSSIKLLYENNEVLKNNRKFQEDRKKKKNDLYFDYDKKNINNKHNSFCGNDPSLLKEKVIFVKNIFDYIYPKIVIKRMRFLDKRREDDKKYQIEYLTKKFKSKYYNKRYKSPEENSALSKYQLNGGIYDESVKKKDNIIKLKKILINGHSTTQLTKHYDYINQ